MVAVLSISILALSTVPQAHAAKTAGSPTLTPVTVQFTYSWKGEYAGLVYADETGLFAKEGLQVTFKEGKGSQGVYAGLGAGMNTFVIGPSGTAAQAVSAGVPVTNVATFMLVTPSVLVAKAGTKLSTPKDLEGKNVGLRSGADAALFFDAFLKKNHVDPAKVKLTHLNGSAANAAFLSGSIQVVDVFSNNELPILAAQLDQAPNTMAFSDFGFPILGQGVTVSNAFKKKSPDVIKRFLRATIAGILAAKKDPLAAAKVIKDRLGVALPDQSVVNEQVKATLNAMNASPGHSLGWVSSATWNKMLDLFKQTNQITTKLATRNYYSDYFLPRQ